MRIILSLAILLVSAAGTLCAQEVAKEQALEIAKEQTLDEVTIVAHSVIDKGDRKLIHPTQQQIKTSTNGLELLNKLQLPRITVDIISGEVTTPGNGEVQLRINGVQVGYSEISALHPADILRVEYHDVPGARYGNADAVIDYITRTTEKGGYIRGGTFHALGSNRTSIDDMIAGKYSHGKSEWTANAHYIQRKGDWTREYDERFIFPDKELHRAEVGEPTLFNKKLLTSNLSYSLQDQGKYFFNAQLKYTLQYYPGGYEDRKSKLYSSDSELPLSIYDHTREKNHLPVLDLYYQQNLHNNQTLIFNVVGTYIGSNNTRIYQETKEGQPLTDLLSHITGKKYSLIAEGIYEKKLGTGKFTGGLKHMQAYTHNQYEGSIDSDIRMRQSESFVYAEYQGKIQQLGYRLNGTLSRFYYTQELSRNEKYAFQPSLLLSYVLIDDLHFRYKAEWKNNTPSIAYLNDVEQPIDNLQIRRGNPALHSFRSIIQEFNAAYDRKFWGVDALVTYNHENNPIMESVLYEDGVFVRTYENQKSFQHLNAEVTFKLKPWKEYITLSVTPGINRYISTGNNYRHTYTMKELRINVDAVYKNWILNFSTIAPPNRNVYGEQLMKGDMMHALMLGFMQPSWSVMAGVFNPFIKTYRSENANWSALNPVRSDIHSNNMSNTVVVKLNFNLNFGKQTKGMNKTIQNMDTDSGIMQGTKN